MKAGDRAPARAYADRVLPDTPFNLEKLNSMDAGVRLTAAKVKFPARVPLENFVTLASVEDGALALDPLNFRFAGGEIAGKVVRDASREPLAGSLSPDFKRVKLSQLFAALERLNLPCGSRTSMAANWSRGDRPAPIRRAAAVLEVKTGIGTISTSVFDAEESRIAGGGGIDFRNERIDATLRPEAKKPGLLSVRGPIHGQGPFRDVSFAVAPQSLVRGLGAIALGLVNPLLALLPLVETGPGEAANCRAVLEPVKGAVQQSGKSVEQVPTNGEKRTRGPTAPIVDVPARN